MAYFRSTCWYISNFAASNKRREKRNQSVIYIYERRLKYFCHGQIVREESFIKIDRNCVFSRQSDRGGMSDIQRIRSVECFKAGGISWPWKRRGTNACRFPFRHRRDLSSRILDVLRWLSLKFSRRRLYRGVSRDSSSFLSSPPSDAALSLSLSSLGENKPTDRLERLFHRDGIRRIAYVNLAFSSNLWNFSSPFLRLCSILWIYFLSALFLSSLLTLLVAIFRSLI